MAPAQGWHAKSWSVPHFLSAVDTCPHFCIFQQDEHIFCQFFGHFIVAIFRNRVRSEGRGFEPLELQEHRTFGATYHFFVIHRSIIFQIDRHFWAINWQILENALFYWKKLANLTKCHVAPSISFYVFFSGPIVILQLSINRDNAKNSCKWILRLCQNSA